MKPIPRLGARPGARSLIIVTAVVIAAASGWVYAAIPGSSTGAIDACYETKGGALRVIDAEGGDTCKKKETPLAWPTKVNTFIRTLAFTTPEGYGSVATVACNPGEVATGGGYLLGSGIPMDRIPTVIASQPHGPVANPTEWQVRWYWTPAGEQWEIYVVCAKLP
jgi:hypothetical protein